MVLLWMVVGGVYVPGYAAAVVSLVLEHPLLLVDVCFDLEACFEEVCGALSVDVCVVWVLT